jgi:urease accessory protein
MSTTSPIQPSPPPPVIATTEPGVGLAIRAELRDGRATIAGLAGTEPWLPRILASEGPVARVVLVQSRASLLTGDDVRVRIELGPGAGLEIVELGATVANDVRGGPPASVDVGIAVAGGARLVWLAEPLVASAGCAVERRTHVDLAAGGRVLLGESIVLGRHLEEPGWVRSRTRVTLAGRPLLDETLATAPAWLLRSAVVAGDARMIEGLTLAGVRDTQAPAGVFQAHKPGTLWRELGPAHAERPVREALAARWRALALDEPARE